MDWKPPPGVMKRLALLDRGRTTSAAMRARGLRRLWRPVIVSPFAPRKGPLSADPTATLIDADWVEGSCMWIRREVIEQIGFLDPVFAPAYFEEVDFCRRARRAGWRVVMSTESIIEHYGAGTSQSAPARKRQRILNERNYLIYHAADPDCSAMTTLLGKTLRRGLKALRHRELSLAEWASAVAELPKRIPGIAAKNARDRRNRPCPVLGDASLSTLEQRYYADRVAEMERTPLRSA
jgi:GT2 family glycosyltransferase